jgi:hypothetical protein
MGQPMGQLFAGWQRTTANDPEQVRIDKGNKNKGLGVR